MIRQWLVCDDNLEVLEEHAQRLQAQPYGNYERLLRECPCDMVLLRTPSGMHSHQTALATRHQKQEMSEKPLPMRWKDGLAMVQACDDAGVRLFIVKQNRRNAIVQLLKRAIGEKRF